MNVIMAVNARSDGMKCCYTTIPSSVKFKTKNKLWFFLIFLPDEAETKHAQIKSPLIHFGATLHVVQLEQVIIEKSQLAFYR